MEKEETEWKEKGSGLPIPYSFPIGLFIALLNLFFDVGVISNYMILNSKLKGESGTN